ncbi:hypothetical protein D3Z38_01535 [Clostridiales bacterium]|nr:hypothetical protein [Clostridiales bacterium]
MKRGMSKLLSILLIATLVFTSASVAFAGTEEGQVAGDLTASVKNAAAAAVQQQAKASVQSATTKAVSVEGNFDLVTIANDADLDKLGVNFGDIAYDSNAALGAGYGYAKAVQIPAKGTVIMAAQTFSDSATGVNFGLYKDDQLTKPVDYGYAARASASPATKVIQVPQGGTYYLGVCSSSIPGMYAALRVSAGYINGGDRTITSGQEILVGQKAAQTNYFKFKAKNTGYLQVVSTKDAGYNKVTLCNSKKKALSNSLGVRYAPTFGVKKGTTYYVKIASNFNSEGSYLFKATNTKITEKSGKKKAKAVNLKKNKTVKGTIIAGNGQEDWYKFKLNGKKKVKIVMKGRTNDAMKIQVYQGGKKISGTNGTFRYTNKSYTVKSIGKWSKGTYYIKISRGNKKSSGYYELSWK